MGSGTPRTTYCGVSQSILAQRATSRSNCSWPMTIIGTKTSLTGRGEPILPLLGGEKVEFFATSGGRRFSGGKIRQTRGQISMGFSPLWLGANLRKRQESIFSATIYDFTRADRDVFRSDDDAVGECQNQVWTAPVSLYRRPNLTGIKRAQREFANSIDDCQRPYCPANEEKLSPEQKAHAEALVRRMGYSFRLTKLTYATDTSGVLHLTLDGLNEGVAPFYRNWPLEVGILDEAGRDVALTRPSVDLRRWLPGPFSFKASLVGIPKLPKLRLAVRVADPWEGAANLLRFANKLPVVRGGWTALNYRRG